MNADELLEEVRAFQAAGYRIMLDPALTTGARTIAMRRLLRRARASSAPDLCCLAVERALLDTVFGRAPEADHIERRLEDALRRDARQVPA